MSDRISKGLNRWPAAHRPDAARLFGLALELARPAAILHGVADTGVPTRQIATAIARGLNLPQLIVPPEADAAYSGWLAHFFAPDCSATSHDTRHLLGCPPTNPGLVEDLSLPQCLAM